MVVDFRTVQSDQSPLIIDESSVEIVKSTKFLGVHLSDNLTWSLNTSSITKKAQQHLYFLRRLRKAHLPPPILTMFFRGTIESILSSCITAWFGNCTVSDRKTLQRIDAEKLIHAFVTSRLDYCNALLSGCSIKLNMLLRFQPLFPLWIFVRACLWIVFSSIGGQSVQLGMGVLINALGFHEITEKEHDL
ncbi:gastrula zinc finger protein XlCGF28.1-like [Silurus meridionalis]|uniref:Alkylated DNA repair protein AlkB homologue 8 N-terminal domain-containing protein n=1 Tax=Silurus meridionalis TaxID=175797 RepID=A0A8T0ADW6_SILME|nr:hypothetical protein HF521_013551 [Silurus meridionalis]KAI5089360.1 gastrula zinc finger protein XlCGF28.1-like [Silurus meridionalis]